MIVLTSEQAKLLRIGDKSHDGLLPPVPMNIAMELDWHKLAEPTGLGGLRITWTGRNAVHWHDAKAG